MRTGRGGVEQYEWNAQGRVVASTDSLGGRSSRTFAADGRMLLSETRADGAVRSRRHDAFGRLVESVDYDGAVTRLDYAGPDAEGLVTALPSRIEAADGSVTSFEWDPRGNLASHTDPLGRVRRFLRDERGLTLAVRDALGVLRRFGWTADGLLAWEAAGEDGARIRYEYDGLGRLSQQQAGRDWPTRYRSDAVGRLVEVRRGDGGVVRIAHDPEGNITRHVSAVGNETQWRYDGLPFPVERRDADGTRLRYRYDADLNLVELTNQKDERYALKFDLANRLMSETGFDGRHRTYSYDAAGFLQRHTDAEERGAVYRRDPLGRLLERRHSDGLTDCYGFDAVGRMLSATNDWGEIGFRYAADGALLEESSPAGAILHGYDARGRRITTTLPDGRVIETGWDGRDTVASVSFDGRPVATFQRDELGRETGRQAGALHTETAYDPQGRLVRQTGRAGAAATPVIDRQYAWDNADRLTELVDLERGVRRYLYDPRSRLVGVDGDLPERFEFDPASNIVASSSDSGAGAPGLAVGDRLLMRGDRKFEYDGCGNRVRELRGCGGKVERLYRYNADNQLREVEERSRLGRRMTSFKYDALGRRTEKASPFINSNASASLDNMERRDCNKSFIWRRYVVILEANIDYLSNYIYLYDSSTLIPLAQIRCNSLVPALELYHYRTDHTGLPTEVTNDNGHVVRCLKSRVWGYRTSLKASAFSQSIGFRGHYYDSETCLCYNRFRYYSPQESVYLQHDPIGLSGGTNLASYVSDPINWVDPFGLCPITNNSRLLAAPLQSNPYPDGVPLNAGPSPPELEVNMALAPGQLATQPGRFATTDDIADVAYVRNQLAVTPGFKSDISSVQRYSVTLGTQIQWRPVGPQEYNGTIYPGGGSQIQFLVPSAASVLTPIGTPTPIS